MNKSIKNTLCKLRKYVDGDADTPYEYFMLLVIIVNSVSIGMETSHNLNAKSASILFLIDQICFWIFVAELVFKIIVYNKDFFGEKRIDEYGNEYFHTNPWNISDLIIVIISGASSLPYFAIFRAFRIFRSFKVIKSVKSFRIIRVFKIVNEVESLRSTFKGLLQAIPGILWTFSFLAIFTYVYAIIGINLFGDEFPDYFSTLGHSFLTLCQILTFDSWISQIARPIIKHFPMAWVYFISYAFLAAYVLMNVIIGIIVDSMEDAHKKKYRKKRDITTEDILLRISALQKQIEEMQKTK